MAEARTRGDGGRVGGPGVSRTRARRVLRAAVAGAERGDQPDRPYAGHQRGSGPAAQRDNGLAGTQLLDGQHRRAALQRHHQVQPEGHGPAV